MLKRALVTVGVLSYLGDWSTEPDSNRRDTDLQSAASPLSHPCRAGEFSSNRICLTIGVGF